MNPALPRLELPALPTGPAASPRRFLESMQGWGASTEEQPSAGVRAAIAAAGGSTDCGKDRSPVSATQALARLTIPAPRSRFKGRFSSGASFTHPCPRKRLFTGIPARCTGNESTGRRGFPRPVAVFPAETGSPEAALTFFP
jgi:hypothetical protein